jgi:Carboxypeptidase regulatory-like domain
LQIDKEAAWKQAAFFHGSTLVRGVLATTCWLDLRNGRVQISNLSPVSPASFTRLTPNVYATLDLPVQRTREVSGRIVLGKDGRAAAGVTVIAENTRNGATTRALTYSDGEFYFSRLGPGDYSLSLSESALRVSGAVPTAVRFTVPAADGISVIRVPVVELRLRLSPDD